MSFSRPSVSAQAKTCFILEPSSSLSTAKISSNLASASSSAGTSPFLIPFASSAALRSEEHTSELQSRQYLVCRLLLEKKKQQRTHRSNQLNVTAHYTAA